MSDSTTVFTLALEPVLVPAIVRAAANAQWPDVFCRELLDVAVDRAARGSHATVALFAAAPVCDDGHDGHGAAGVEFAVEFFVPPSSLELFHRELESQLLLASPRYAAGRRGGEFAHSVLRGIAAGTFHQYRVTCRATASDQRDGRWSRDRSLLDGVLRQSRTGWRESGAA